MGWTAFPDRLRFDRHHSWRFLQSKHNLHADLKQGLQFAQDKIAGYVDQYRQATWAPLVASMKPDATATPTALKDRLKLLTRELEALHAAQSAWVVVDSQLRYNIKDAILEIFLPSYQVRHVWEGKYTRCQLLHAMLDRLD